MVFTSGKKETDQYWGFLIIKNVYFCNLLLISPFIPQELAEVSKFWAFSVSGSLRWLSLNSYYFSAWPIHHLECFLIYCRDNVDSSAMEDIHCGLQMKTPRCRFPDRNIIFLSFEVGNLPLASDLWGELVVLVQAGPERLQSGNTAGASCVILEFNSHF